nr:MAG TPA: hypothetical protein [Bacteriophage sp.]
MSILERRILWNYQKQKHFENRKLKSAEMKLQL